MKPQLLIASPMSGGGKTTFSLGLLRALQKRGMKVQPFKCGPDCIDTQYHGIAAKLDSFNLDTWMSSKTHVQYVYNTYGEQADVCVVEGAMGLFDGYNRMDGSSAELALLLNIPVVLVVNARATGYSVAPLLYGFKHFNPAVRIAGVVFNQVVSAAHFGSLRESCMDAGIECLGYLPVDDDIRIGSRHIGLTLTARRELSEQIDKMASLVEKHIDVEKLMNLCTRIFPIPYSLPYTSEIAVEAMHPVGKRRLRIAVARDAAFSFIYKENLDRLAEVGKITYFSPVYGSELPEADLVYFPGGYPELFARQLHRRKRIMQQIRDYADKGGKILAEGGGMMFLSRSLTVRKGGTAYEMAGVLPFDCSMEENRLCAGYRRSVVNGTEFRGHEYHYSIVLIPDGLSMCAPVFTPRGAEISTPFYRYKNVIAGYIHWYWGETDILKLW
ncbi:cobyrinate a,c-diamide synthase [uncultured Bacteroides sp.]|uniref:cobyrinate a,c-diamide synthase n=1 Tax=uncultured Bacteroides sp. TaxID=162156 RepID=UPI0026126564|nr:cobyrinate a,c-diamide synthase [uncultured Bacteroides sp.]